MTGVQEARGKHARGEGGGGARGGGPHAGKELEGGILDHFLKRSRGQEEWREAQWYARGQGEQRLGSCCQLAQARSRDFRSGGPDLQ